MAGGGPGQVQAGQDWKLQVQDWKLQVQGWLASSLGRQEATAQDT